MQYPPVLGALTRRPRRSEVFVPRAPLLDRLVGGGKQCLEPFLYSVPSFDPQGKGGLRGSIKLNIIRIKRVPANIQHRIFPNSACVQDVSIG